MNKSEFFKRLDKDIDALEKREQPKEIPNHYNSRVKRVWEKSVLH